MFTLPIPTGCRVGDSAGGRYLLAAPSSNSAAAAAAARHCRRMGFPAAGSWRSTELPEHLMLAAPDAVAGWRTLSPATGAVCRGPKCRAFAVLECVPVGGAPAEYDPATFNTGAGG